MVLTYEEILKYAIDELYHNLPSLLSENADNLKERLRIFLDEADPAKLSNELPQVMQEINKFLPARNFVFAVRREIERATVRDGDYQPPFGNSISSEPANLEMVCPQPPPGHCVRRAIVQKQKMRCWLHSNVELVPKNS